MSSSSDSEEEHNTAKTTATGATGRRASVTSAKGKITSASSQSGTLKRKQSISVAATTTAPRAAKRKHAESTSSATEDATGKYCLGKYTEMFTGIFKQYPYFRQEDHAEEAMVERKPEELTEEKTKVRERATAFAVCRKFRKQLVIYYNNIIDVM
jgi:hypothetical protein